MRLNLLPLFAAVLLVAACETAPEETGDTTGGGDTTATTGGTSADVSSDPTSAPPAGPVPGSQEDLNQTAGDRVFFGFDRYDLTSAARETLRAQAAWMQANPGVTVTVEGHADERGTREYNLALGERRANSIKNYLIALGVDGDRVRTISFGKERPTVLGSNEAAWAANRRGVTLVGQGS